jgi:organic radical activating enzyme
VFEVIQRARTLSLMPTYRCTAACQHCGTFSSPRNRSRLDAELTLSAIDQAIENKYQVVVFTGGEPTLLRDELLVGIGRAAAGGLVTRVVTNAWWAADDSTANQWITALVEAGLHEINFSTGDQHVRFVPLEHVLRACRAAARCGRLTICLMVEIVEARTVTQALIRDHPIFKDVARIAPDRDILITESPWMPISARTRGHYADELTVNRTNILKRGGCNSCLSTTSVQADGRIAACCGLGMRAIPELQTGHIRRTSLRQADATAEQDFLKRWIRVEGPERILAWAANHDPSIEWEDMYAHRCQACLRIYKDGKVREVIRKHHTEKMADVFLAEWLLYHFDSKADAQAADPSAPSEPGGGSAPVRSEEGPRATVF